MRYRPFAINLQHDGNVYDGIIVPLNKEAKNNTYPIEFSVTLNGLFRGLFIKTKDGWESTSLNDNGLVNAVGAFILDWYS